MYHLCHKSGRINVQIGVKNINNLWYADNTTSSEENEEDIEEDHSETKTEELKSTLRKQDYVIWKTRRI